MAHFSKQITSNVIVVKFPHKIGDPDVIDMAENGHDTKVSSMQERVAVRLLQFWPDKPALWFA